MISYEVARLVEREATGLFRAVVYRYGRAAPRAPDRIEVSVLDDRDELRFGVTFSTLADRHYGFIIPLRLFQERVVVEDLRHSQHLADLTDLYMRLRREHMIDLDLRPYRDQVERASRETVPDFSSIREWYGNIERNVRRRHAGYETVRSYSFGTTYHTDDDLYLRRMPPEVEALALSHIAVVREEAMRDAMMGATFNAPPERPEPSRLTADMVRALAGMLRDNPILEYRVDANALYHDIYGRPTRADNRASAKGLALLKEWLSPEQRKEYEASGFFHVKGNHTGKTYRIYRGAVQNIEELDPRNADRLVANLCFGPAGDLVDGDCMLAQKIAIETDEEVTLRIANRVPYPRHTDYQRRG